MLLVSTGSARAQSPVDVIQELVSGQLAHAVQTDPQTALSRISQLLPAAASDVRAAFDLLSLRAEAQALAGQRDAQLATLTEMALLAQRARDTLGEDPIPLLEDAATLAEDIGQLRSARRLANMLLAETEAAGLPRGDLAAVLDRIARLAQAAGDTRGFEQALSRLDRLLTEPLVVPAPGAGPSAPPAATRSPEDGFDVVEVFYATDRAATGDPRPSRYFGGDRGALTYGTLEVSIPRTHRPGAIEAPRVWRLEFTENPAKHVVLRSVTPTDADAFFDRLKTRVAQTPRAEAIVFVHGYNVTFDQAAKRAAQLAYDTGFGGVPILYSWPSRGSTASYIADTAVVNLSGRRLTVFLEDLVRELGTTTIHLVAHSMGNRALTDALELYALRRSARDQPAFGQIVFAAPDLDAGLFGAMIPTIRPLARRITLYGSENDWALVASRKLHGDAPRAGEGGPDALALADVDTIDMSDLGEDMLAHSYISNDSSVLLDLVTLFWRNLPPQMRCGIAPARQDHGLTVWKYVPGACRDDLLIGVLARLSTERANTPAEVAASLQQVFDPSPVPPEVGQIVNRMVRN